MLQDISKPIPGSVVPDREGELIPDPWEDETPTSVPQATHPWMFHPEQHPLMAGAEPAEAFINPALSLDTLRLPDHTSSPGLPAIEVLLQDEMKVNLLHDDPLTQQLETALTLLWWVDNN